MLPCGPTRDCQYLVLQLCYHERPENVKTNCANLNKQMHMQTKPTSRQDSLFVCDRLVVTSFKERESLTKFWHRKHSPLGISESGRQKPAFRRICVAGGSREKRHLKYSILFPSKAKP